MCKLKKYHKTSNTLIDRCMRNLIKFVFNPMVMTSEYECVACCCGHGKYPMSIVVRNRRTKEIGEICSAKILNRTRNFYKKDKQGYYYIPETVLPTKHK